MGKLFIFCVLSIILISCSHVEVSGFDRSANSVTIETAGYATEADAQKEANKYCGTNATLVSMDKRFVGTTVSKVGDGISSSNQNHLFYTYSCKK